jgi:septal ring factor EnvC (AmiA/AmiB activator)
VDVWTRVQKNGNNSIIYLAVKDPQGNYLSGETDSASVDKIKDFLYDFARAQNYSSNDLEIGALIDSVQTDQTAFEQYTSERTKIETQIKELQSQLQAMEQKHTASRQEMDRRRQRLEQLTATSEGNVRTEKSAKDNKNNNDDNNRQDQKK